MTESILTDDKKSATAQDEAPYYILYQTTSQHWAHAEQVRWALLYNFLMAATILLLAWAAIYGEDQPNVARKIPLILFAGVGCLTSFLWIGLCARANGFVTAYAEYAKKLEVSLSAKVQGPFHAAYSHRNQISGFARWVESRRITLIVPSLFSILFFVLFLISILA
ncbi:MAG: hypothetical protein KJ649_07530 [Proteobacteria bacterium]|nr:hypothetical protein [Pseudomonadota bacterium]